MNFSLNLTDLDRFLSMTPAQRAGVGYPSSTTEGGAGSKEKT